MARNPIFTFGCTCSEHQLTQVGCDCGVYELPVQTVCVWKMGYAGDRGTFQMVGGNATDADRKARELFGCFARVYDIRTPFVAPVEHFSEEYIKQMSMGG